MSEIARPKRRWSRILNLALRLYLSLVLAGCASKQLPPSIEEIRQLETRSVQADFTTAFDASINLLQDLGFTVDVINPDAGIITASKQTEGRLGNMFEETGLDTDDDGLPTWAKVLIIVTGVIIIVGIIALIAGDDDDDDDKESRSKGDHGEHGGTATTTVVTVHDVIVPEENEYYNYRLTLNLEGLSESETKIRTSVQGNRMKGDNVEETGSVYDARFFSGFYSALDKALSLQTEPLESVPEEQP